MTLYYNTILPSQIPNVRLQDGYDMPVMGYAAAVSETSPTGSRHAQSNISENLTAAINSGLLSLQSEELYAGQTELRAAMARSALPRNHFFITAKAFSNAGSILTQLQNCLDHLSTDYVDLFLLHLTNIDGADMSEEMLLRKWRDMIACVDSRKVCSIGVSNFAMRHLGVLLSTDTLRPVINQTEFHPYKQHKELVRYTQERGISHGAYDPYPAMLRSRNNPGPVDVIISNLAEKYGVSEEAIVLKWCISLRIPPIITQCDETRMKDCFRVNDFELLYEEVKAIYDAGD